MPARGPIIAVLCALGVLLLALPRAATADGKIFSNIPAAKVDIPDQEALIAWHNGQQTLAIETRFTTSAGNAAKDSADFAWVVPLPSIPEITPASPGLFPSLRAMTAPLVREHREDYATPLLLGAALLMLVIYMVKYRRTLSRAERLAGGGLLLVGFLVLSPMILMMLGKSRGIESPPGSITTLHRAIVGSYDAQVVSSTDPGAMSAWLKEHGYIAGPDVDASIAQHVRDGWCFAALRLRTDASTSGPLTPHPVVFRFASPAPTYPLRLTGVNNGPLRVDLYVFGSGTARSPHFAVERSAALHRPEPQPFEDDPDPRQVRAPTAEEVTLTHAAINPLAGRATHVTKLTATLQPEHMLRDATIEFTPFQSFAREFQTALGRHRIVLNAGSLTYVAGLLLTLLIFARRWKLGWCSLLPLAPALIVGGGYWLATPAIDAAPQRPLRSLHPSDVSRTLSSIASAEYDVREPQDLPHTPEQFRKVMATLASVDQLWTTEPKEGDAPGQYTILERDGKVVGMAITNLHGAQQRIAFPAPSP